MKGRELCKAFDEVAQDCLDDQELAAEASYALKDPALLANRDHSPLTAKERFFDKNLVAGAAGVRRDRAEHGIKAVR